MNAFVDVRTYGTLPNGESVRSATLRNNNGVSVTIMEYGARVIDLVYPDRNGGPQSLVLGYGSLEEYMADSMCVGATIGRVAGRIRDGRIQIGEQHHQLNINDGTNHLHGGDSGFHHQVWRITGTDGHQPTVEFSLESKEGQGGYPGNLKIHARFSLTDDDEVSLEYRATTDRTTLISPTNHSYFNLSGDAGSSIDGHYIRIATGLFTPFDETMALEMRSVSVAGTPADAREFKSMGDFIDQLTMNHGEHYVFSQSGRLKPVATVRHPDSGRRLDFLTTAPCMQFYGGHHFPEGWFDRTGTPIPARAGFCIECQEHPGAFVSNPFSNNVILPGETYRQTTVWRLSTEEL